MPVQQHVLNWLYSVLTSVRIFVGCGLRISSLLSPFNTLYAVRSNTPLPRNTTMLIAPTATSLRP